MKKVYRHVVKIEIFCEAEDLDKLLGEDWKLKQINDLIESKKCLSCLTYESNLRVTPEFIKQRMIERSNEILDTIDIDMSD